MSMEIQIMTWDKYTITTFFLSTTSDCPFGICTYLHQEPVKKNSARSNEAKKNKKQKTKNKKKQKTKNKNKITTTTRSNFLIKNVQNISTTRFTGIFLDMIHMREIIYLSYDVVIGHSR